MAPASSTLALVASGNGSKSEGAPRTRTLAPPAGKESRQRTAFGRSAAAVAKEQAQKAGAQSPQIKPTDRPEIDDEMGEEDEDDDDKPRRRRRHRGGKRRTEQKQKQLATRDPGLVELLLLIAKLLAQTAQKTRLAAAVVFTTLIVPTNSLPATRLKQEGANYAEHAASLKAALATAKETKQAAGEQEVAQAEEQLQQAQAALRNNGPPAAACFLALLESALPDATPIQQAGLKAVVEKYLVDPPPVDVCRLESCSSAEFKKIVFHHPEPEVAKLLVDAITRIPTSYAPRGPAPQGAMEEQLSDWISALHLREK